MKDVLDKLLCVVMFKDEESILARCLDSVKSVVDGYLLLDTGSTDSSIEIAKTYTDNVITSEFEDFVITKNVALEYAYKNLKEYSHILWMDADEYLDANQIELFQSAYRTMSTDVLLTNIRDYHNETSGIVYERPRIWRNAENIRFTGPGIHEYISFYETQAINKELQIVHSHKTTFKESRNDFYIEILSKYHKKEPDDTRAVFYLGRTYMDMRDYKLAIEYYTKYHKVCQDTNNFFKEEYWYSMLETARAYKYSGDLKNSEIEFKNAIEYLPGRAEAYHELGLLYHYDIKDNWKAIETLEAGSKLIEYSQFRLFVDRFSFQYKMLDLLSLSYYVAEDFINAKLAADTLMELPDFEKFDSKERIKSNYKWFKDKAISNKKQNYNINDYFDGIYVINLDRRLDRKESMTRKLEQFGISAEFFRAYDGQLLKPFVDPNILVRRTPGYLACLLSHIEVIKNSYAKGMESILILEDDAIFHKNFSQEFEKSINQLVWQNKNDWDLFYLGGAHFTGNYSITGNNNDMRGINDETRNSQIWDANNVWSGHAYALSRKLMKFILDYYETDYIYELDRMLASEVQGNPNFKCVATYPQLIMQHDTVSDNTEDGNHLDNYLDRFLNKQYSKQEDYIF